MKELEVKKKKYLKTKISRSEYGENVLEITYGKKEDVERISGSGNLKFGNSIINDLSIFLLCGDENIEDMDASLAVLEDLRPQDPIEAHLISQMITTHALSMKFSKLAALKDQTFEGQNANINRITKLNRTYMAQMDALIKYRKKGESRMVVEHVSVNEGGQAIVGNVTVNRGSKK